MTLTAPRTEETIRQLGPTGQTIGLELSPPAGRSVSEQPIVSTTLRGFTRVIIGLLMVLAVLLQRILLPQLPYGPADLMTVLVACFAIFTGPATGCIAGFGAGMFADALSDHALGRLAAVLCLVGYACGLLADRRRLLLAWPVIALACVATPLLFAASGAFASDHRATGTLLLTRCVAGVAYGFALAPFAYVFTWRLLTRRRRLRRSVT